MPIFDEAAAVEAMARAISRLVRDKAMADRGVNDTEMAQAALAALKPFLGGWRTMESAPKDGTHVLIWFVHDNAKFSKDPISEGWAAAHEAHWIDHNGGGWTWHGLCGVATMWQPLPASPDKGGE